MLWVNQEFSANPKTEKWKKKKKKKKKKKEENRRKPNPKFEIDREHQKICFWRILVGLKRRIRKRVGEERALWFESRSNNTSIDWLLLDRYINWYWLFMDRSINGYWLLLDRLMDIDCVWIDRLISIAYGSIDINCLWIDRSINWYWLLMDQSMFDLPCFLVVVDIIQLNKWFV